jgi:hypothetical protein
VHLAYLDETGTDGHSPVAMFGALIVPVGRFGHLSGLHSTAIQQILPIDRIDEFREFHACELYKGTNAFEGIEQKKRFTAIQVLLAAVKMEKLPYIYAAVDRKKFAKSPFGTGKPLHAAFHMCLLGIEDWATANHANYSGGTTKQIDWNDMYLCVLDDCDNKTLKDEFRKTYRTLRSKHPFVPPHDTRLWHAHDDMFFADSKDCLGIQIVDLCNYFVRRHLAGEPEEDGFYGVIAEQIICARPEPESTSYRGIFRSHD